MAVVRFRGLDKPGAASAIAKALRAVQPPNIRELAHEAFDFLSDEVAGRLQRHLADYRDPENPTPRTRAEWWMKREIRFFYAAAYREGRHAAGDMRPLDTEDEKLLRRMRLGEYRYLRGFLDDMDAGRGKMNYRRRMQMYADAVRGAFWLGFVRGNRSNRRRIRWVFDPEAEHCKTCAELNGRVWTPRAFLRWYAKTHILPQKGCECLSNCRCHLEEFFV